jgi:hypothetical protein
VVFDVKLMEPPGAEVGLLISGLERIAPRKATLEFLASDRLIAAVRTKTANYPNNAEM